MTWIPSKGMRPRTKAEKVFVQLRCGLESKTAWPVKTSRWHHINDDFDIMAYRPAEDM